MIKECVMTLLQGQRHTIQIAMILVWAIIHYCNVGFGYFIELLSMTQGSVMTCHHLDQRSHLQGQGHNVHTEKIYIRSITSYWYVGFGYFIVYIYFTFFLSEVVLQDLLHFVKKLVCLFIMFLYSVEFSDINSKSFLNICCCWGYLSL